MIFNKPRIIPFNPNSDPITIGDNYNPTSIPIRPTTSSVSPLPIPTGSVTETLNGNDDDFNAEAMYNKLYQPEHQNIDRLNQMIDQMPVRNKPGMLRKIFGGIAQGLGGGPEGRDEILYRPYYNQLADWQQRLKPVEASANIERQNNANERAGVTSMINSELGIRRINRQMEADKVRAAQGDRRLDQTDTRIGQSERRIDQADRRIDIAAEVAKGGVFKVDDAGNASIVYRDGTEAPVDASYLSYAEKERMKAQSAENIARIRATTTAANQRDRVRTEVVDDPDNPGTKIAVIINQDTGEVRKATITKNSGEKATVTPTSKETATETGKDVINKANQIKNSNPKWSGWIKIDGNKVTITTPGIFGGGITRPTKAEYDQMYQAVFGTKAPEVKAPETKSATNSTAPSGKVMYQGKPYDKKPGKTLVLNANGQVGYIDTKDVSQIPKGWKVIE